MLTRIAFLAVAAFALLAPAQLHAGPPLICHPYDVGVAKTLPDQSDNWSSPAGYDRKNLIADTLGLLTPDTPVLVRMETLRRAALYASAGLRGWSQGYSAEEKALGYGLLAALHDRATRAGQDALALFDAGFFAETLRQTGMPPSFDGYALLVKAAALRGADPEVEFALALASVGTPAKQAGHLARARAAAKPGSLLATNLATHFDRS